MDEYQWRPNMARRVRSLSALARQYGLDPENNRMEYHPTNCGNCGRFIPLRLTTLGPSPLIGSSVDSLPESPAAIVGDPRCPECGRACHPESI